MTNVTTKIETITPQRAKQLLGRNPQNRNIRRSMVDSYARDMTKGRWQFNGDSIRVDRDGNLIDGQHRLSACVASGVPITVLVIYGLPNAIRDTIDGGAKRSHGDRLAMRGIENANFVSSIARSAITVALNKTSKAGLTGYDLDEFIESHPNIHESARACSKVFPKMGTIIGTVHLIGYEIGLSDRADAMVHVWKSGTPDYEGCPMHYVRERIARTRGTTAQMSPDTVMRLVHAAWPPFAKMRPVKLVKPAVKPGIEGWNAETAGIE